MNESLRSTPPSPLISTDLLAQPCILHVCTSCRRPGSARDPKESRPGFILYKNLRDAVNTSALLSRVEVKPAECLSVCPRPCGFALTSPGSWTYLFGDQPKAETISDILECIATYMDSPDGFMARTQRPQSLRGSILGRVPPIKGTISCT